jgi:hypothetical protein
LGKNRGWRGRIPARWLAGGERKMDREREEVMVHLLMYLDRVWDALRWLVGEEQGAAVKVSGGAGVPRE